MRHTLCASGVPHDTPNPLRSGIHTRGYLPHVKREGASYFVTFRMADSLPQEVLLEFKRRHAAQLRALRDSRPDAHEAVDRELQRQIKRYLDRGLRACHLKRPEVAQMVAEALCFFYDKEYWLDDWAPILLDGSERPNLCSGPS